MWQAEHNLYLYPTDPYRSVHTADLCNQLERLGFTGNVIGKNRRACGDHFLDYLCFMGCSPDIELEPNAEKPFCYIECNHVDKAHFVNGTNTRAFECQTCGEPLGKGGNKMIRVETVGEPGSKIACPNCQQELPLASMNWRKSAFYASCWIRIGNIYQAEALPDQTLLDALTEISGSPWKYAYIREPRMI